MNTLRNRVVFRADGNSKIGLGHIVRSMALAYQLESDYEILFICKKFEGDQKKMISDFFNIVELETKEPIFELVELEKLLLKNDILVLDGYSFDLSYQKNVLKMIDKLVMIDDLGNNKLMAHLVINHGGQYIVDKYKVETYTKILAGFKYLLIRKEFLLACLQAKKISEINNVFICMGGADPFHVTPKVLKAAFECDFINRITVVIGNSFTNEQDINQLINSQKQIEITIEKNVNAKRMVELIQNSEIAICPSSSIALEVCCVKSGLLTGTVIDNQNAIHEQLLNNECAISLGDFNTASISHISQYLNKMNNVELIDKLIKKQAVATSFSDENYLLKEFKNLSNESKVWNFS